MLLFTADEFAKMRIDAEGTYAKVGEVLCPYLKEKVAFNAQGLEHLKFKRRDKARSEQDQYMRFKLLAHAADVVRASHTVQGIQETKHFERVRVHGRTDTILQAVTYYEFIAVIKRNRVKVIVKQIEKRQPYFWSLIPFWGMNNETQKRILHEGLPEED
jgi:hypothetical protein